MKRFTSVFILIILPVLLFSLFQILGSSKGEMFLSNYYDPSYAYLMNALNLSQLQGFGVGHIDHPGTTVHIIGAIVIYFINLFQTESKDVVIDVFSRPEFYLSAISLVINIMNSFALFILGLVTFKRLNNIGSAVFLQLTPFFSVSLFYGIMNVIAEPLLIFTVIILITISISYITNTNVNTKTTLKYIIAFGLICGFGLVTKITFFPLLIIPIILFDKISSKVLFCFITLIAAVIFFAPAISADHIQYFKNWIRKLILFNGKYGGGEKNIVDTSSFFKNLFTIFVNEPLFSFSYITVFITSSFVFIVKFKQKIKLNRNHRLLIGLLIAMTVQIIIVCKHFELHYLIPGYLLSILGLYISNSILTDSFPRVMKINKLPYIYIVVAIFAIFQINSLLNLNSFFLDRRVQSYEFSKYVSSNYDNKITVSSYGVSKREFALFIGALFSGSQKNNYYSILNRMFPDNYYWDISSKIIHSTDDINVIKNRLVNSGMFLFECKSEGTLNDFIAFLKEFTHVKNILWKKVFATPEGEAIYEIRFD